MDIKLCSTCNEEPKIQTDELGITYRLICEKCDKFTCDLISPNSNFNNPHCDEHTFNRLVNEWNSLN